MNIGMKIYRSIREKMKEAKIKNVDIAKAIGKSPSAIDQNFVYLKRDQANLKTIISIVDVLDMDIYFNLISRKPLQKLNGCFIDRSITQAGGKTIVTFSDGYQVFFSAIGLSNEEYLERAKKIRSLENDF